MTSSILFRVRNLIDNTRLGLAPIPVCQALRPGAAASVVRAARPWVVHAKAHCKLVFWRDGHIDYSLYAKISAWGVKTWWKAAIGICKCGCVGSAPRPWHVLRQATLRRRVSHFRLSCVGALCLWYPPVM